MANTSVKIGTLLSDDYDTECALHINRTINYYAITPIACVGVSFNCLALWNLHKKTFTFKSVALNFLFKALAVADISYTIFYLLWWYSGDHTMIGEFILSLPAFGSRFAVVGITLLVTVSRWIAVRYPFKYRSLVNRYRMRVALLIVVIFGALVKLSQMFTRAFADKKTTLLYAVSTNCIILSSTIVTETALTINLVKTLVVHQRKVRLMISSSAQKDRLARGGMISKAASASRHHLTRGVTPIVLTISAITFVSYPIGVITVSYFKLNPTTKLYPHKRILFAVVNLVQILNSNVNFFIYVCCMPEFRKQMLKSIFARNILCYSNTVDTTICPRDSDVCQKRNQRSDSVSVFTTLTPLSKGTEGPVAFQNTPNHSSYQSYSEV